MMTPPLQQAFFNASGIHANQLSFVVRLTAGLLITVVAVFVVAGLIKLLEERAGDQPLRVLVYLITLSLVLMLFYTFVAG